jgi:hypothetical protein
LAGTSENPIPSVCGRHASEYSKAMTVSPPAAARAIRSPASFRPPVNTPPTGTSGPYRSAKASALRTSTVAAPGASRAPAGKVKSTPSVKWNPERSSSAGPAFVNSMNSKSYRRQGLPAGGAAGWYMTSVTRRGIVSTANGASVRALHVVPLRSLAFTVTAELRTTGPLYSMADGDSAPPGRRGSEPSRV